MSVQTISTTSDIPKVLDPFYLGRPGKGTVGQPGYEKPYTGLIDRGFEAIFPEGLTGAEAYAQRFQPLIEQGLVGAGTVAPMSQFQQALGTQLGGMTMPDQFALAEQSGQAGAAGLQALLGVQAPEFGSAQAQQYMSPYMQNVVDMQQRGAIDAARQAQLGGNLAAARQGTYGGARQAILQGQRESGLRTQLGDIRRKDFSVLMNRPNNSLNVTAQPVFKLGKLGLLQRKVLVGWLRHLVDSALNSLPVSLTYLRLKVRLVTSSARSLNSRWMHNAVSYKIRLSTA
jgi:hypothetical protein